MQFAARELEREEAVHQKIADRLLALRTEERAPSRVSRRTDDAIVTKQADVGALYRRRAIASLAAFCLPFGLLMAGPHLGGRQSPTRQDPLSSASQ